MAAAIRIKLIDLLKILTDKTPKEHQPHTKQIRLFATAPVKAERHPLNLELEGDLELVKAYLRNGPARRSDLEMELNFSRGAVLHRLSMLRERGMIVDLPNYHYGLKEAV
jgi:hypothetical protein